MVKLSENHEYFERDVRYTGVNELLKFFGIIDYSYIPKNVLENARRRGEYGHLIVKYMLEGILDESTIDEELKPYYETLKRFFSENGIEPLQIEEPVAYRPLLIAGTPDLVCMKGEGIHRVKTVIDWKFTSKVPKSAYLQVGGYMHLCSLTSKEIETIRGEIVHIRPDGYDVIPVDQDTTDEFMYLVLSYHTIKKYTEV